MVSKENRMIGLVFDVDDTLYEQIVPFENSYKSLFDMDIDMEKFYLLSRYYSDVKFEASRNGEMTMDEYHIYRIQEAAKDLGVYLSDEEALNMQKEYKKNSEQGKFVAKNTTVQTVGVAGGLGGAWIGIKLGGAAGAPGGFLGAIGGAVVGGVIGAWGGEAALEAIAEKTIEFFE